MKMGIENTGLLGQDNASFKSQRQEEEVLPVLENGEIPAGLEDGVKKFREKYKIDVK